MPKPIVYDLYCGLGGWSEAFIAEGYEAIGFDIEAHDYGSGGYPGELRLRDILTLHGSELKDATCIVGSSPCQKYSYMAMPWKRAKAMVAHYADKDHPERLAELNALFNAQFRIQREASEAAGHHIPMVVENVRGAQKWVGRAVWNYGSFYLWGDVPALMPMTLKKPKVGGIKLREVGFNVGAVRKMLHGDPNMTCADGRKVSMNFHEHEKTGKPGRSFQSCAVEELHADRDGQGIKQHGSGAIWYRTGNGALPLKSPRRKAASAMIAKIPFPLAQHIARAYKPVSA